MLCPPIYSQAASQLPSPGPAVGSGSSSWPDRTPLHAPRVTGLIQSECMSKPDFHRTYTNNNNRPYAPGLIETNGIDPGRPTPRYPQSSRNENPPAILSLAVEPELGIKVGETGGGGESGNGQMPPFGLLTGKHKPPRTSHHVPIYRPPAVYAVVCPVIPALQAQIPAPPP